MNNYQTGFINTKKATISVNIALDTQADARMQPHLKRSATNFSARPNSPIARVITLLTASRVIGGQTTRFASHVILNL